MGIRARSAPTRDNAVRAIAMALPRTLNSLRLLCRSLSRGLQTSVEYPGANGGALQPLRLSNIRDNPGARKKEVRVGRGRSSGCGKTSGRGQKGQKARGSVRLGFEGGQTPLHKRLPKINYHDPFARPLQPISLSIIQRMIDLGRLSPAAPITMADLVRCGAIRRIKYGVLLVPGGNFVTPAQIQVTEAVPEAANAVIDAGGSVTLAWYTRLGLRALIKPEKWHDQNLPLPRWAAPPPKWEHRYPERSVDGVPVRTLASHRDVTAIAGAWQRIIHLRNTKAEL